MHDSNLNYWHWIIDDKFTKKIYTSFHYTWYLIIVSFNIDNLNKCYQKVLLLKYEYFVSKPISLYNMYNVSIGFFYISVFVHLDYYLKVWIRSWLSNVWFWVKVNNKKELRTKFNKVGFFADGIFVFNLPFIKGQRLVKK